MTNLYEKIFTGEPVLIFRKNQNAIGFDMQASLGRAFRVPKMKV